MKEMKRRCECDERIDWHGRLRKGDEKKKLAWRLRKSGGDEGKKLMEEIEGK